MLTRRTWLTSALVLLAPPAHGEAASPLSVQELAVAGPGASKLGKKCLLLRPTRVPADRALPLLVLFHGLGETSSEALGIRAWYDRYGLPQAYARLGSPPVTRTLPRERYLSDERLEAINRELLEAPFPDLAIVCPFTPNVFNAHPSAPLLDRYADYLEKALLPAVRAATPTLPGPEHCGVDGVSLGGYVSFEVFLRKPELFGVVGGMQAAISQALAEVYARRLAQLTAELGPRAIHLTTTRFDPFREATLRLSKRLSERGVPATLTLGEGPHDQRYLREAGTLETLLFQARALHR